MKRCAVCHQDYEDIYDGCPFCAAAKVASSANTRPGRTLPILLWLVAGLLMVGFVGLVAVEVNRASVFDNAAIPAQVEQQQAMTEEQAKQACWENQKKMAGASALDPNVKCPSGGVYSTTGASGGYMGDLVCSYHSPKNGYWEYWY